jgi:hypothetical protein
MGSDRRLSLARRLWQWGPICIALANCHSAGGVASGGRDAAGAGGSIGSMDAGVDRATFNDGTGGVADAARTNPVGGGGSVGGSGGGGGILADAAQGTSGDGSVTGGDGAVAESCLGPCLEAFLAQCPNGALSCVSSTNGSQTTTCYSNGVKSLITQTAETTTGTLKKANGDICLQYTKYLSHESIFGSDGSVVAEINFNSPAYVEVSCLDGTMTEADLTKPQCAGHQSVVCTSGPCVW